MRTRFSRTIAGAVLAAGLAAALAAGCGRPDDDTWLQFLGFRQSGSDKAVSVVKGQLDGAYDETTDADSVLDAAFTNVSAGQADINGTGILINRARVEYSLPGAPVYEYPVTLYLAPPAKAGETTSGTLSGIPIVPPSLEDWVIAHVSTSEATFTARVTFFAEADEGTDLDVSGGITIVLEAAGGSVPTPTATTVTIEATVPTTSSSSDYGVFTVLRSGSTTGDLTVFYSTAGSTAAAAEYLLLDKCYMDLSGSVVIPNGYSLAIIYVEPLAAVATAKTVVLTLNAGTGYTLGSPKTATVTIES
jgi:hypothetical protein